MLRWIIENFNAICSVFLGIISIGSTILVLLSKNDKTKKIASAVQYAIKMLPSLITVSENVNGGGNGSTKEAFVMSFIENMFNARGITVTDDIRAEIKENIANIVKATKELHVESKGKNVNEENSGNVASGTTGLRVIS